MDGITDIYQYLLGCIAIVLFPGPNSLYCLSVAGQYGARHAYQAIIGIFLGNSILISAAILGGGVLLQRHPALFTAMKIAGGTYLAYLGVNLLRDAWLAWQTRRNQAPSIRTVKRQNFFRRALTLSLTNPKAILFFLSFFLTFVRRDAPNPTWSFFILAAILQTMSFSYLNFIAFIGYRLAARFVRYRLLAILASTAVGLIFLFFAGSLLQAIV